MGRVTFGPDSQHVAYEAQSGGELHIILDGATTGDFSGILHGAALVFDGPRSLNTFVYRGPQLLGVHVELK